MRANVKLKNRCEENFNDTIKERGINYYKEKRVISVVRNKSVYYAKVKGQFARHYYVKIYTNKFFVDYECSCPCEFPCKHIYAVLLSIDDKKYRNVYLKNEVYDVNNNISLKELLRRIPSKELKKYLVDNTYLGNISIDVETFKNDFFKYLRRNPYIYYYNNLYNACIINFEVEELLDEYFTDIIKCIDIEDYLSTFNIIKAIIEALFRTRYINKLSKFKELLLDLEFYLKIIYRTYNTDIVDKWFTSLENKNYYHNIYLKNMILNVKNK